MLLKKNWNLSVKNFKKGQIVEDTMNYKLGGIGVHIKPENYDVDPNKKYQEN